ncbi:hypothetical protein BC830DRAFT_1156768 [Chytriomyces sp. MP71]|nr:hypothetical protein BC830DRAFT_1156768 [Chytriomyces sp. MP71]
MGLPRSCFLCLLLRSLRASSWRPPSSTDWGRPETIEPVHDPRPRGKRTAKIRRISCDYYETFEKMLAHSANWLG